jgi:hypothetical protein
MENCPATSAPGSTLTANSTNKCRCGARPPHSAIRLCREPLWPCVRQV